MIDRYADLPQIPWEFSDAARRPKTLFGRHSYVKPTTEVIVHIKRVHK